MWRERYVHTWVLVGKNWWGWIRREKEPGSLRKQSGFLSERTGYVMAPVTETENVEQSADSLWEASDLMPLGHGELAEVCDQPSTDFHLDISWYLKPDVTKNADRVNVCSHNSGTD